MHSPQHDQCIWLIPRSPVAPHPVPGQTQSTFSETPSMLHIKIKEISRAERDLNATALQKTRKAKLDQLIDAIRLEQDTEDQNRALSLQLVEECSNLEVGKGWSEVERTEDVSTFVRLQEVYSLKPKQSKKEDISTRVNELEFARSEKDRDLVLGDLLSK